jgi:hypothetical protein
MPYYVVEEHKENPKTTLLHPVKAKNQAQALAAIVKPRFTVRTSDTDELLSLQKSGAEVVDAGQ